MNQMPPKKWEFRLLKAFCSLITFPKPFCVFFLRWLHLWIFSTLPPAVEIPETIQQFADAQHRRQPVLFRRHVLHVCHRTHPVVGLPRLSTDHWTVGKREKFVNIILANNHTKQINFPHAFESWITKLTRFIFALFRFLFSTSIWQWVSVRVKLNFKKLGLTICLFFFFF